MADHKDTYTLEALLTGNNSRLKKVVDQAVMMLERLENRKSDDVKIDGDVKPLQKKVEMARRLSESLDGKNVEIDIDADTSKLSSKVKQAEIASDLLDKKKAQIEIIARNSEAIRNMQRVRLSAKQLSSEKPKVDIEVEEAAAVSRIARFKAVLKSIPNKVRVRLDADPSAVDRLTQRSGLFQKAFRSASNSVKDGFGETASEISMMQNALMALAPAAIPIVASLVPAVMAVGNAIAVVGGGAIGLAGALGIAGAGVMIFGAMATSAYNMLQDGTLQATAETHAFNTALDNLKGTWAGLIQSNQAAIFTTMANGVNIAKTALSGLNPFITGVSNSMAAMSTQLLDFFNKSAIANNFFAMLNTTGVSTFRNVLGAAGNFGAGLMAIFTSFGPLFTWMGQGLANMSAQFLAWSTSVSTADGIRNFISYVQTNLPVIGSIFGNVFTGIFNLFTAFGSNSQTIFGALQQMAAQFAAWSETVGQSQGFRQFIDYVQTQGPIIMSTIGNIVTAVIAFATAMAPVGAAVLGVVSSIAQWVAGFAMAHPQIVMVVGAITSFIGALGLVLPVVMNIATGIMTVIRVFNMIRTGIQLAAGAFALLTNPIGLAVVAIGLIIAALVIAYQKFEGFRNVVNAIGQALVTGFQMWLSGWSVMYNGIVNGITTLSALMQGWAVIIGGALGAAWNGLVAIVTTAWAAITAAVTVGISLITTGMASFGAMLASIFTAAWNGLVAIVTTVWVLISTAVQSGIQFVISGLTAFGSMILFIFSAAWNGLISIVTSVWSAISSAISAAISIITSVVSSGFNAVVSTVISIMSSISSAVSSAWSAITSAVSGAISAVVSAISSGFSAMLSTATSIMSSISSAVASAWSAITSAVSSAISTVVSFISSGFSQMLSVATSIMSSILSAIMSAWSSITSAVSSAISTVVSVLTSGFSTMISAVTSFASSLISSITSAMSSFISAVTSGASSALSALTSGLSAMVSAAAGFVGEMMSAGHNLIMGMVNGITGAAGSLVSAAVGAVKGAIGAAKAALGIHSPSRVFKKIGYYTVQGLVIGIEKDIPRVATAIDRMLRPVTQGLAKLKSNNYNTASQGAASVYGFLTANMATSTKKIDDIIAKRKTISDKIGKLNKDLRKKMTVKVRAAKTAEINRLKKQYASLHNIASGQYKKRETNRKTFYEIRPMQIYLTRIAKKREELATRISAAQDKLDAVLQKRTDFKNSILNDTRGFASIGNAKVSTSKGLIADMQARYKAVAQYADNINKLKSRGVSQNIIGDLLAAGIDGGAEQARILANASKATIQQLNTIQKNINSKTSVLADRQASDFFNVGVNAARGIVEGLKKQDKALQSAAIRLADLISNTVKKRLGIHSPSRVFAGHGAYTVDGLIVGVKAKTAAAVRTMSGLATKVSDAYTPKFTNGLPDIAGSVRNATANVASQVNADVINTVRNEPVGVTLNANFALGNRDYNAFVGDITDRQNTSVRLEEVYDV